MMIGSIQTSPQRVGQMGKVRGKTWWDGIKEDSFDLFRVDWNKWTRKIKEATGKKIKFTWNMYMKMMKSVCLRVVSVGGHCDVMCWMSRLSSLRTECFFTVRYCWRYVIERCDWLQWYNSAVTQSGLCAVGLQDEMARGKPARASDWALVCWLCCKLAQLPVANNTIIIIAVELLVGYTPASRGRTPIDLNYIHHRPHPIHAVLYLLCRITCITVQTCKNV